MLPWLEPVALSERDQQVYATVVPAEHYLRRVSDVIDFERFRPRWPMRTAARWADLPSIRWCS